MRNIVVEGARGVGKSTVTQLIRSKTQDSTLVNFTGFNEEGQSGLVRVMDYYASWMGMFRSMKDRDFLFIHDRFFFSELVYSKLYKDYDFTECYNFLVNLMPSTFNQLDLFVLVTSDTPQLEQNLKRDKVMFFDAVQESVNQSYAQQRAYVKLAEELDLLDIPGVHVYFVSVDNKSPQEIAGEILALSNSENPAKI